MIMGPKRMMGILVVVLGGLVATAPAHAAKENMTVDELLEQARTAASNDRHAYAIQLYLRAVARDSTLRTELGVELGNQYTWFDKPDSAVIWYNYYLEEYPDDIDAKLGVARALAWGDHLDEAIQYYSDLLPVAGDRKTEARLGLAKTLAWRGDHEEAEAAYRNILEDEPDNLDAQLGLAQAVNWAGRYREAQDLFKKILDAHPGNHDALEGLAYAQYWAGRSDLALQTIAGAPAGVDLGGVSRVITEKNKVDGELLYIHRDNSTDGDWDAARLQALWVPRYRTQVGFAFVQGMQHKGAYPDIERKEFQGVLAYRWSETFAISATLGPQFNSWEPFAFQPGDPVIGNFDLIVWDIYATVTPRDYLRIDVGTNREVLTVPTAIFNEINFVGINAGVDWRPRERLLLVGQVRYEDFSDDNRRWSLRERFEYTPSLRLAYRWSNYFVPYQGIDHFSTKFTSPYYFSPLTYTYPYVGLRFVTDIGDYVNLNVSGHIGYERSNHEQWLSKGGFGVELSIEMVPNLYINTGYLKAGSRITSPDGFRMEYYYLGLNYTYLP